MGFVPMAKTLPSVSLRDRLRRMIPDSLCSDEGVDLLCSLLKLNPADRLPIEQVCLHSYFRDCIYDAVMRKGIRGKGAVSERRRVEAADGVAAVVE